LKLPSAGTEKLAIHLRDEGIVKATEGPGDRTTEGLQRAESIRDPDAAERALNVRRALGSVRSIASWLADVQGRRKALLFFSEGFDVDIYEPFTRGLGDSLLGEARQAIAAAQRANVTIYGIDPRGLSQFGEFITVNAQSDYPQLGYGTFGGSLRELLLSQESLISLAEQTGGLAIVRSNDVAGGLARIVLDTSRYYLLGYYSDATNWSDKFLKIDVRIKRPGLHVRSRQGFLPPDRMETGTSPSNVPAGASAALAAALRKPIPEGQVGLRVFAAPFKGTGRASSVLVALEVDAQGLTFQERDGRYANALEVSIVATDARGRVQGGDSQTFDLQLLPDTYQWFSRTGARLLSRLDLPPGRYQIRVGVHETGGGRVAMVPYDLEVPDYSTAPLGLSGVLMTSSDAETFATANPDPSLKGVLPAPPVATRRFKATETLVGFAEVYGALPRTQTVDLLVQVRRDVDGMPVFTARDQRTMGGGRQTGLEGVRADIPLKDWAPGFYILRVEAKSGDYTTHREVPFEVVTSPPDQHQ
jgi:VWFA-related protein